MADTNTFAICSFNAQFEAAAKKQAIELKRPELADPYLFALYKLIPQFREMEVDVFAELANIVQPMILTPDQLLYEGVSKSGRKVTNAIFRLNGFDRPIYREDGVLDEALLWIDVNIGPLGFKHEGGEYDRHISLPMRLNGHKMWDGLRAKAAEFIETNSHIERNEKSGKFLSFNAESLGGQSVDLMRVKLTEDRPSAVLLLFEDVLTAGSEEGLGYTEVGSENFTFINPCLESSRSNLGAVNYCWAEVAEEFMVDEPVGVPGVAPTTPPRAERKTFALR